MNTYVLLTLLALAGGAKRIQFLPVTVGPCDVEREIFQNALGEELQPAKTPVTEDYLVITSVGWNDKSQACYMVCLNKTEGYPDNIREGICWTLVVRQFEPEQAAKIAADNIRVAIKRRTMVSLLDGQD